MIVRPLLAAACLACSSTPEKPLVLVTAAGSKLPSELIGEFRCSSDGYRSQLTIFADGRYHETKMLTRHGNHWEPIEVDGEPCDPFGKAAFAEGVLSLRFQWATCEQLSDPVNLPVHLREWRLTAADASGFSDGEHDCRRTGSATRKPD
ncbi:MAG: hypothetical protein JNK04_07440 [Myxococcales bacterium]|nr:hypothetical protein [Myxococcales bacterium]